MNSVPWLLVNVSHWSVLFLFYFEYEWLMLWLQLISEHKAGATASSLMLLTTPIKILLPVDD
jgi:hypothetical protein